MITIQKYIRPQTLEEAYQLNQSKRSRIVAGMLWTRLGTGSVGTAIDLCDLALDTIEETDESFTIGAMVTLRQLEQHPGLNAYTQGAMKNALQDIVGVQFRNMATAGGSIWGRYGFSDVLTLFLAMDTYVELYRGGMVPLEEFARRKADRDILVRLIVKKTPGHFVYTAMRNQRTDLPVLTCAMARVGEEYRACLGARPARAVRYRDNRGLLADGITAESAAAFAQYLADIAPTESNLRGSAQYRTHLIRVLAERALGELGGMEHGN